MKKIRLVCNQQIGDCLRTTTVAKLMEEQYSDFMIRPVMSHPCVYENNPNVDMRLTPRVRNTSKEGKESVLTVVCKQDDENDRVDNIYSINRLHYHDGTMLHGMVGYINAKYGFSLEITQIEPDIYLTEEEKERFTDEPYWLINTGGAKNNTKKLWPDKYWRELFKSCPDINFVQTGLSKEHYNYSLEFENVTSMLDCTIRQSFGLAYNAIGIISHYSYIMHAGAAFHKPIIAIGGGVEHPQWENYNYDGFNLLHTVGSFECCRDGGCWNEKCENTEEDGTQKCMELITPDNITNLIKGG